MYTDGALVRPSKVRPTSPCTIARNCKMTMTPRRPLRRYRQTFVALECTTTTALLSTVSRATNKNMSF